MSFKVGDRVEIRGYADDWDGAGTITRLGSFGNTIIVVELDSGRNGGFDPQYVHLLSTALNPTPTSPQKFGFEYITKHIYEQNSAVNEYALTKAMNELDDDGWEIMNVFAKERGSFIIARRAL